ncbi:MAG: response regulator transcription factor [Firmicutes bacterium]|nr:response regulator transcription factor [Bacillota bacterium]
MNIALVDDSESDRMQLESILKEYNSIHQLDMVFHHFCSGEDLLAHYQPFRFAVIFLDIYMENMSGIETAKRIRKVDDDAVLVFLTSSEAHRSDAFSVFASAYLEKPCSNEEVFRTADHLLRLYTKNDRRFSFSFDRKDYSLFFSDIISLETDRNYLLIEDCDGNKFRTRMTFSAAESQLDSRFLTLMKGIAVNMDHIQQFTENQCIMQRGRCFPLPVRQQRELKQKWLNYKFSQIRENAAMQGGCL